MNWSGKKVLVTGAGGFIGSHLVEKLVERGADVQAFVRYNSWGTFGWLDHLPKDVSKSVRIVQGDLRDLDSVMRAVKDRKYVFHLGAMICIPYSYVSPTETAAVNVDGTLNVLNACRMLGIDKMIHTSTSEVYGTAQYVPMDEGHPLQGQSPYSASKIGADKLAESFYRTYNLPVTTVRPFNTYGPRQSARAVIPTIIAQLLTRSELKLGSLTPTRDFTYVTDTAEGMIKAAEAKAVEGKTLNLGTKSEITIGDLAEMIAGIIGVKAKITSEQERMRPEKSEVNRLYSENAQATELLGWKPNVSLKDGLAKTVPWMKENLEFYKRAQMEYVI